MRVLVMAVAGLMVSAGAQAQTGSASTAQLSQNVFVGAGCPAGLLRAQQQTVGGATVWTTAQEDLNNKYKGGATTSMGVHVNFDSVKNPVQSLELSVSYLPLKLRVMPVAPGGEARPDPKKTFVLKQEAALKVDGDLMVGPASTIQSVHLISATFANGSVWRAQNEDSCTVVPSRVLLVGKK